MSAAKPKRSGIRAKEQPIRGAMARRPGSPRDTVVGAPQGHPPRHVTSPPPVVADPRPLSLAGEREPAHREIQPRASSSMPPPLDDVAIHRQPPPESRTRTRTHDVEQPAPPSKLSELRGRLAQLQNRVDAALGKLDAAIDSLADDEQDQRLRAARLVDEARRILCRKS